MTVHALASPRRPSISDRYTSLLLFSLFGYAMLGKGFAYAGFPPLFIGEFILVCGFLVFLRSGTVYAALASTSSLLIATLMAWVLFRTLPFLGTHGLNALRDSVIAMYGLFTFIVIGLLLEAPQRLRLIVELYRRFATIFIIAMPFIYVIAVIFRHSLPAWPGAGQPVMALRGGEVAVHLAGAAIFTLLGFRRATWFWLVMLAIGMLVVFSQSRGGALAVMLPVAFAVIGSGRMRQASVFAAVATLVLGTAYAFDLGFGVPGQTRGVEVRQVIDNLASIFYSSGTASLDGTKAFRVNWWSAIVAYTFDGPYFWTGKGFGVNLAVADGFVVGTENAGPPLRSPHNAHMTVLARAGVPGLALWILVCFTWFATLLLHMAHARRRKEDWWANLFLFIACYVAAILVNASFDVALEGPMLGIWFWALIGLGIGSTMIYRYSAATAAAAARERAMRPPRRHVATLALALLAGGLLHAPSPAAAADDAAASPERRRPVAPGSVISNPEGSCLTFHELEDAIIEDIEVGPCGEHGISLVDSRRVIVRNVRVRDTADSAIHILNSESIRVTDSKVRNALTGVFAQGSRRIQVDCNRIDDVRGPVPSGQFVQFNTVHGPDNRISCNIGRNRPGRGRPEDAISLYKSTGVDGAPILVDRNVIVGGGPSLSGGGIMLGDAGGAYQAAIGNILVDPGQYGIGVASGNDMLIRDNLVFGRMQPFTNVGIYVWNQYPHRCERIVVAGNRVRWQSKSGQPNPFWDGRNCGVVQQLDSNNFTAALSEEIAASPPAQCRCATPR